MDDLATLQDATTPVGDFLCEMTRHVVKADRRFRALDPTGQDLETLQAISNLPFKKSGLPIKYCGSIYPTQALEHGEQKNSFL